MKKYVNYTNEMRAVVFADGDAQFLFRGQKIVTDKEVVRVDEGIKVIEVATPAE